MSGKFGHRTGLFDSFNYEIEINSNYSVPLRHELLPATLRAAGYRTYGVGKWNLGFCNAKFRAARILGAARDARRGLARRTHRGIGTCRPRAASTPSWATTRPA